MKTNIQFTDSPGFREGFLAQQNFGGKSHLSKGNIGGVDAKREHDYIAFDEYYNEPIRRSFGNCDIYNTTITWLRKHDHMARYFPIFLVFGAKFQYFDNGE